MMKKIKFTFFLLALLCIVGWGPFYLLTTTPVSPFGSTQWIEEHIRAIRSQVDVDLHTLRLGLKAYAKARVEGLDQKELLTIIDYSKASYQRRLLVIDVRNDKVLFHTWVAHGKNSGEVVPTSFSNQPGSLKSSVGVFLTDQPYVGGDGYSLRLIGLEHGINDKVYDRKVVMHGAQYVGPDVIKERGRLGRSWGCPAVSPQLARPIIDTIKGKTLVFVYAPDRKWLSKSSYLTG